MKKSFLSKVLAVVLAVVITLGTCITAVACTQSIKETQALERSAVAEQIVEIARTKIGFYPSQINEFTNWYYGIETETAWCTVFISWCADQVGALGTAVPKMALVSSMKNWFDRRGEYYPATSDYVPQKGDIMFINTALDGTDNVHHIDLVTENGFVEIGKGKGVRCISGNTSNLNYEGSEYVTEKTRPLGGPNATIIGYAHPSYEYSDSLTAKTMTFAENYRLPFVKYIYAKLIEYFCVIEIFFDNLF